jgi:hypothetical protein
MGRDPWKLEREKRLEAPCGYIGGYGFYAKNKQVGYHIFRCNRWDCVKGGCGMRKKERYIKHFTELLKDISVYYTLVSVDSWNAFMKKRINRAKQNYALIKTVNVIDGEPQWNDYMLLITDGTAAGGKKLQTDLAELLKEYIPDRTPKEESFTHVISTSRAWKPPKEDKEKADDSFIARLPWWFAKHVASEVGLIVERDYIKVEDTDIWETFKNEMEKYHVEVRRSIEKEGNQYNEREIAKKCRLIREKGPWAL